MFAKALSDLTMTGQAANNLWKNINGEEYRGDQSFTATLRIMLNDRIGDRGVTVFYDSVSITNVEAAIDAYKNGTKAFDSMARAISADSPIKHNIYTDGCFHVCSVECISEEHTTGWYDIVDAAFLSGDGNFGKFKELKDISVFLHQKGIESRFYIDTENNNVQIFINRLDIRRWHLLQSFIPRYFPQFFSEKPMTEEELALLKSLTMRDSGAYERLIEQMAQRFDFRTEEIRTMLAGFGTSFVQSDLRETEGNIETTRSAIREMEERFSSLYSQLQGFMVREAGLRQKLRENNGLDDEIIDYFLCNKGVTLVSANNGRVEFIVSTIISSYDPEVFDNAIRNRNSFFYKHYYSGSKYANKEMSDDRIERLMRAVFETEELKLRTCAAYMLDFSRCNYVGREDYPFPSKILADHTPNQHIQHYGCLGNNGRYIGRAVGERDIIGAVAACCASATNFNMTEAQTGTYFMECVLGDNPGQIIQMPDGSTMTPLDAVKWLEARDGETE